MHRVEYAVGAIVGAIGALFGGWGLVLDVLLLLQALDFVSGIAAAAPEGKISSKVGWRGLSKKICTWVAVLVAYEIGRVAGVPALRDGVALFYVTVEAVSIIENLGEAGVPMPALLVKTIEVLRGKSES